jgi:hypothetical protein
MNVNLKISLDLDIVSYAVLGIMPGSEIKVNCTKNGGKNVVSRRASGRHPGHAVQVQGDLPRCREDRKRWRPGRLRSLGRGAGAFFMSAAARSTLHLYRPFLLGEDRDDDTRLLAKRSRIFPMTARAFWRR